MTMDDCTHCIASGDVCVDLVHPVTGLTICFGKTLEQCREKYPDAELMLFEDFAKRKAANQRSPWEWNETTEEAYNYGLEVLPPAYWKDGVFMVGEPYDHYADTGEPTYQAYKRNKDGYWKSSRAISVRELEGK